MSVRASSEEVRGVSHFLCRMEGDQPGSALAVFPAVFPAIEATSDPSWASCSGVGVAPKGAAGGWDLRSTRCQKPNGLLR